VALVSHEALKAFQADFVEDVGATEDGLLLKSEVFIADGARFLLIKPE